MATKAADRHPQAETPPPGPHIGTRRTHRRRWPWVLLTMLIALVTLFYVGGGYYFSSVLYRDVFEVRPGVPATTQIGVLTDLTVPTDQVAGTVTMALDSQYANPDKYANATVGIKVGDSLIVAGPATESAGGAVTRPVLEIVGPAPVVGSPAGVNRDVWTSPDQLGLEYTETMIDSGGAAYPAWVIPASSTTWAILIHGKGGYPAEMLRMATTLHERGINCLLITYANDPSVPRPAESLYGYGTIEVPQVEAAVDFAQSEGAERIILGGVSHGAAVSLGFLETSTLADSIDAVILDSPPADLTSNIDAIGDTRSLPVVGLPIPESLETVAMLITQWLYHLDFDDFDHITGAGDIAAPTLIFQGGLDTTVDASVARTLASAMGSGATLVEQPQAQHVGSWNVDPEGYAAAMGDFLDSTGL